MSSTGDEHSIHTPTSTNQTEPSHLVKAYQAYRNWIADTERYPELAGHPTTFFNINIHVRHVGKQNQHDPDLAAAARDPNTTVDVLIWLAGHFPAEFCDNQAIPLLLLEHPNLVSRIPESTLLLLLQQLHTPRALLRWIATHSSTAVAETARLHINFADDSIDDWQTRVQASLRQLISPVSLIQLLELLSLGAVPSWLLTCLIEQGNQEVRRAAAQSADMPETNLKLLRRAGASGDLRWYAPPDPTLPGEMLEWLAHGGPYARKVVARNPYTPTTTLEQLARDPLYEVRQAVARNPATPTTSLERLARDPVVGVRQLVARHHQTPVRVLVRLSQDNAHDVRFAVARNAATPLQVLEKMAGDPKRVVRQGVSRNAMISEALLVHLAADQHTAVRKSVAAHQSTPLEIVEQLSHDADQSVRRIAFKRRGIPIPDERLSIPHHQSDGDAPDPNAQTTPSKAYTLTELEAQVWHADPEVRTAAAAHPALPTTLMERLADDEHAQVRAAVATNPSVPATLLRYLADDLVGSVCRAVAAQSHMPLDVFELLARDFSWSNESVRLALVHNPAVPVSVLEGLVKDPSVKVRRAVFMHRRTPVQARERLIDSALESCLRSQELFCHLCALAHPRMPPHQLISFIHLPYWQSRYAITQNPIAPVETLVWLTEDANHIVRQAAHVALEHRQQAGTEDY